MFTYFLQLYSKYAYITVGIASGIALLLAVIYFIFRKKESYYESYWKGFLLIFMGSIISDARIFLSVWSWITNFIEVALLIYGFILISKGAKQKTREQKT